MGGPIFSICSVYSLTQCHSWNSLPCSHQQTFSIATFYRPPATTISFYSTSSSPEKENSSSNRLGTPPRRGGGGRLRSQKGLRPFNPLQRIEYFIRHQRYIPPILFVVIILKVYSLIMIKADSHSTTYCPSNLTIDTTKFIKKIKTCQ